MPPSRSPEPGAIAHLRARLHAGRHDDVWHLGLPPRSFAPSPRGMLRHGRGPNSPRLSMGPSTRLPRVQQSSRQTSWRLHPRPSYGRPIPTLVSAMILTPTLSSIAISAFVDNLAELPRGYFCEIGLNSDRSVLTSLRSSLYTGIIFLFFEYIFAKFVISAPGWSLSIVFCLIEIEDDLAVNAGCRHSRGSLSWPFLRAFLFVLYLLLPLPVRRVVCGPATR